MAWCDGRIFPTTPLSQMHEWAMTQELEVDDPDEHGHDQKRV